MGQGSVEGMSQSEMHRRVHILGTHWWASSENCYAWDTVNSVLWKTRLERKLGPPVIHQTKELSLIPESVGPVRGFAAVPGKGRVWCSEGEPDLTYN